MHGDGRAKPKPSNSGARTRNHSPLLAPNGQLWATGVVSPWGLQTTRYPGNSWAVGLSPGLSGCWAWQLRPRQTPVQVQPWRSTRAAPQHGASAACLRPTGSQLEHEKALTSAVSLRRLGCQWPQMLSSLCSSTRIVELFKHGIIGGQLLSCPCNSGCTPLVPLQSGIRSCGIQPTASWSHGHTSLRLTRHRSDVLLGDDQVVDIGIHGLWGGRGSAVEKIHPDFLDAQAFAVA